jgi:3-hydroxypropanoate dehydrogenase
LLRNFAVEDSMTDKLDDRALDRLFRTARTRNAWTEQPVSEQQLREPYDLLKFGPTSGNCCPARFVWVRSAEGKHRLAALAALSNAPKIPAAPVTVIVGYVKTQIRVVAPTPVDRPRTQTS